MSKIDNFSSISKSREAAFVSNQPMKQSGIGYCTPWCSLRSSKMQHETLPAPRSLRSEELVLLC